MLMWLVAQVILACRLAVRRRQGMAAWPVAVLLDWSHVPP